MPVYIYTYNERHSKMTNSQISKLANYTAIVFIALAILFSAYNKGAEVKVRREVKIIENNS